MRITLKIWKFFKRNIPSPALKIPHSHPRYTDNPFRVEVRVSLGPNEITRVFCQIKGVMSEIPTVKGSLTSEF